MKGVEVLKFDREFNVIKIRHVIIMYLLIISILLGIMYFISSDSNLELSGTNINFLCLLADVLFSSMLIYVAKPSKNKLICLYKDFRSKLNIKEIALISLFLICLCIGGAKIITDIMYMISPSLANTFINDKTLSINSITDYIICFTILVIFSPIVDELVFRYTLFRRLAKKFNIYVGLIVSAIIFTTINIQPEILGTLALGIVNCILYVKYKNILISMLIYSMNNLITMTILVPLDEFRNRTINYTINDIVVNALLGIGLFVFGMVFMIKFIAKNKIYLREQFCKSNSIE